MKGFEDAFTDLQAEFVSLCSIQTEMLIKYISTFTKIHHRKCLMPFS